MHLIPFPSVHCLKVANYLLALLESGQLKIMVAADPSANTQQSRDFPIATNHHSVPKHDTLMASSLLRSGEVSTMLRQGFSPSSPLSISRFSPPPTSPPPTLSRSSPSPTRPSTTLFQMIARESPRPPPADHHQHRRRRLQELISQMVPADKTSLGPGDVELSVSSRDGFRFSMLVHRRVLVSRSRFFMENLGRRSGGGVAEVEICDCDDVELYVEMVGMMYCGDLRRRLAGQVLRKVLGFLKVSADVMFDAGVAACLEYLEAVPWSEDEEEEVVLVLHQLQLHESVTDVLQRVSTEVSTSASANALFLRLLDGVLQSKDDKARRDMKEILSKLLSDDKMSRSNRYHDQIDVSRETLFHLCHKCLSSLDLCVSEAVAASKDNSRGDLVTLMGDIAREANNVQWLLEILIGKKMGDEFVMMWAEQIELAALHSKIPCVYRYEISRITAQLCVALGRRQILVPKDARFSLLQTWLEPLYDDFSWMKRACRNFDNKMVEDGLCQTILTLPMAQQQMILLRWFDRFLKKGDDCPNIQRAFEVWWRRSFVRQHVGDQDQSQLQIALCEYESKDQ